MLICLGLRAFGTGPDFLVREVCCWFVFLQGKAGAVFSEVPHSVLLCACSMHTMAFSWPPPSPVLCALLGLHDFFDFLHLVLIESVLFPCLHCLG